MTTTVLYIEDNERVRMILSKHLKCNGYHVISFPDPMAAKGILEAGDIDIVLSDLHFEGVSKSKVEEFLRECITKDLPVVLLTASKWSENPADIQGITIIPKPLSFEKVFEAIERSLERNKKGEAEVPFSENGINSILNPDWHVQTPIGKWGEKVAGQDSLDSERNSYSRFLKRQGIQSQLDMAFAQGNWSRRELNEMMDLYFEFTGEKSNIKPRVQKKTNCVA
jgi:DNA-binding response OmpR family regulator